MKLQPIINNSTQVKDPEIKIYKVGSEQLAYILEDDRNMAVPRPTKRVQI